MSDQHLATEDRVYQIRRHHAAGDHYAELGQAAIGELLTEIDRLTRAVESSGLKRLQADIERDCAVEDVARLARELAEVRAELATHEPWRAQHVPKASGRGHCVYADEVPPIAGDVGGGK